MKKIIIFTFLLALSLSAMAYNFKVDGLYYSYAYAEGECWLTRNTDDPYSGKVNVPATVSYEGKSYKVVSIVDWAFSGCEHLTSVTLPVGLISINPSCFSGCSALKEIIIPETVKSLGRAVFDSCTSLETVVLPGGLADGIYPWAFSNCTSLKNVTLGEGITQLPERMFNNCTSLEELVVPSTVEKIDDGVFHNCTSLRKLILPESLKYFGSNWGCRSLQSIDLPESLTYFGGLCASGLISCILPSGITEIVDNAFGYCEDLKSIEFKGKVKSIGNRAFESCSNLISVSDLLDVETLGNEAFQFCTSLKSLTFSDKLKSLCSEDEYSQRGYNFRSCKSLEQIDLGNSVEEIPTDCFSGCYSLKTFHVPSNCKVIGVGAFCYCKSLTSIEMPEYMESIGYDESGMYSTGTFKGCESLESIIIPEGITILEDLTLANCPALKTVKLPSTLKGIEYGAFMQSGLTSLELPSGLEYIASSAIWCDNLEELVVPKSVKRVGDPESSFWLSSENMRKLTFEDCKDELVMSYSFNTINLKELYIGRDVELQSQFFSSLLYLTKLSAGGFCTDITWLDTYTFRKLNEIEMSMMTPPSVNDFYFSVFQNVSPVIDADAYEAYSTAPVWKNFKNYDLVEGFCSVSDVMTDEGIDFAQPYGVYMPDGKMANSSIDSLPTGLYIVRQGNKTGKIIR